METKNLIGGLLVGAVIGVSVGILLAPQSGKKTMSKASKKSKRFVRELKNTVDSSFDSLKTQYNKGVSDTAKRGKEVIANASERIKI